MSAAVGFERGSRKPAIPGGGKRKNRDARKEARRQRAELREDERSERSAADQINLLIERGYGHCKEANRLRGAS